VHGCDCDSKSTTGHPLPWNRCRSTIEFLNTSECLFLQKQKLTNGVSLSVAPKLRLTKELPYLAMVGNANELVSTAPRMGDAPSRPSVLVPASLACTSYGMQRLLPRREHIHKAITGSLEATLLPLYSRSEGVVPMNSATTTSLMCLLVSYTFSTTGAAAKPSKGTSLILLELHYVLLGCVLDERSLVYNCRDYKTTTCQQRLKKWK